MAEKKLFAENGQPWSPSAPNGKPATRITQSPITNFFKPKAPTYAMAPGSPPPVQTFSMGDIRGCAPSFKVGADNQTQAEGSKRSPERAEDWVRLSPPKVEDLSVESPSGGDGVDERVIALPEEEEDSVSASEQLRREHMAARYPRLSPRVQSPGAKALDSRASIVPIQKSHVSSIKRINGLLLCISYPPWFYQQLSPPTSYSSYSRAIVWRDKPNSPETVIGSLITRRDPVTEFKRSGEKEGVTPDDTALYIAALTLLSPYRSKGLAQAALESVIRQIVATPATQEAGGIKSLYAHVWTENQEGVNWYKKMGFHTEGEPVQGYYQRLEPSTAWVLRRHVSIIDSLPLSSSDRPSGPSSSSGGKVLDTGSEESDSLGLNSKDLRQSTILKRPSVSTARSFMSRGPENEWNDLPEHMVMPIMPRSGTASAARTPGASAPPSGPPSAAPSRAPSVAPPNVSLAGLPIDGLMTPGLGPAGLMAGTGVGEGSGVAAGARKKKKSRAYPAAAVNGDVVNGSATSGGGGSGSGSGM